MRNYYGSRLTVHWRLIVMLLIYAKKLVERLMHNPAGNNSVYIHERNLQILAAGLYNKDLFNKDLLLPFVCDIFKLKTKQTYNLRRILNSLHQEWICVSCNWNYLLSGTQSIGSGTKNLKSIRSLAKNGHQRNILEDFVKSMLVMTIYFSNVCKIYGSNCVLEKNPDGECFPRRSSWSDTFYLYFSTAKNRPKTIIW